MHSNVTVALSLVTALWLQAHDAAPQFSTLITTPLAIEGLTADDAGNLYTTGRAGANGSPCPVWRITRENPALVVVGFVPAPSASSQCAPSGLAFNGSGALFVTNGSEIDVLVPSVTSTPMATTFVSGVPGTNGLTFDRDGNLWTGDGTTALGRVWRISPAGTVTEIFRVQPMRNSTGLGGVVTGDGVGRQVRTFPPGTAANTLGAQDLVANGVEFNEEGDLLIADTARGAIWKAAFDSQGNVKNRTGCDETFTANTLCLDSIWVAHPLLEGIDGFALDRAGNVWAAANERNAIVFVKSDGSVEEVFRNPAGANHLRNAGPLELPTSPVLFEHSLCTASSDGNRRDNSPNSAGEIAPGAASVGKISCMDRRVPVPGLPLPIR